MSVLSRRNWIGQQRVDLSDLLSMESFNAFDLRALVSVFSGSTKTYIVRGFEVVSNAGLSAGIKVSDSVVFNPQDANGSFYLGLATDPNINVDLPANQPSIFVEAVFTNQTQTPVITGIWDALSLIGDDASGQEFSASVDFENVLKLEVTVNTVGFTEGAIPLFRAATNASAVTSFIDSRQLLFRLATGGATPDPLHKYEWSATRAEPVPAGTGVGDAVNSPWRSKDASGAINDKAFKSVKDLFDAFATKLSEVSGSAIWYLSGATTAPVSGLSLNQLFFDTIGHSLQPSKNAAFKWKTSGGNLVLASEGIITLNGTTGQYHNGLIKWKSNYATTQWELGGVFVNNNPAGKRNYLSTDLRFISQAPVDGGNIYLAMERDVPKGSGDPVNWNDNTGYGSLVVTKTVRGVAGDFTGIALGDYIRKESEGYSRYYKVVKMQAGVGGTIYNNAVATDENFIADSTITALELDTVIASGVSTEPLRYFRSRYASADVVADLISGFHGYTDANFYWLGRREGSLFYLRDYGTMQEGEEVTTLDAVKAQGQGGGEGLMLEHAKEAIYENGVGGYKLSTGATTTLLTIRKRKRDNTLETPTPGSDNANASMTYNINAPIGSMNIGDGLWVRLSDDAGGFLAAGSVTNTTDDQNNTDTSTNKWEVRSPANNPVRSNDNIDVHLVARLHTIAGMPALIFADGTVIAGFGQLINNRAEITGDLKLTNKTDTSILFMAANGSKEVHTDADLVFDETARTGSFLDWRFTDNSLDNVSPAKDIFLLASLGTHTAKIGGSTSTIHIPGDLIVDGGYFGATIVNLQVDDKLISLGVGSLVDTAYGGGLELADDTKTTTQFDSYNTFTYIDLTYGAAHGYALADIIGVSATGDVGGITAGEIGGQYTVVAVGAVSGDAEIISPTVLRIWTNGTATSTATSVTNPPRTYKAPWSIRLGASDGTYTAGLGSWIFRVKNTSVAPALTPAGTISGANYDIVPTASSAQMSNMLIAYAGNDGLANAGADSTLKFDTNFSWNDVTSTLSVGNIDVSGDIIPTLNDTYKIGDVGFVWSEGRFGATGVYIGTGRWYESPVGRMQTNSELEVDGKALFRKEIQVDIQGSVPALPDSGTANLFYKDGLYWQQSFDGNQKILTNEGGNVYEENVDIVSVPVGNNQAAPLTAPAIVTIPKDTKKLIGITLVADTTNLSATVVVTAVAHGLVTSDLITVITTTAIGGISAANLSVTNSAVTFIDADHFSYVAGAAATSTATGQLDKVTAVLTRYYIVGNSEIEVYLNGERQTLGFHYAEVGLPNTSSNQIQWLRDLYATVDEDKITYRMGSNGGQLFISGGASGSLQAAYGLGSAIVATAGFPVTMSISGGGVALYVIDDLQVDGLII